MVPSVLSDSWEPAKIAKILIGIFLFLVLAVVVIIPLLSSADKEFANKINFFYLWIKNLIAFSVVAKFIVFCFLSVFLAAGFLAWNPVFILKEKELKFKDLDAIISGIALCGVLVLYLLFLFYQNLLLIFCPILWQQRGAISFV